MAAECLCVPLPVCVFPDFALDARGRAQKGGKYFLLKSILFLAFLAKNPVFYNGKHVFPHLADRHIKSYQFLIEAPYTAPTEHFQKYHVMA